jgi:nitrite reductase/ring-hydroxylating ferredoxin subunit
MITTMLVKAIESVSWFQKTGSTLSKKIHQLVLDGGEPAREVADALHGTWLGHPLHPALIPFTIGAWSLTTLLDFISLGNDSRAAGEAADILNLTGNLVAVPTVLAGLADYSTVPKPAAGVGLAHAALNDVAFTLNLASGWARKERQRGLGIGLSTVATGVTLVSGLLGGHMAYAKKVGVNHAEDRTKPEGWTDVLGSEELKAGEPQRVTVSGQPVLLYKRGGKPCAVGAVCSHAGGPLQKGEFHDHEVQCPWHDSVFHTCSGEVIHGPATYRLPDYEVRERDGKIQVRVAKEHEGGKGHKHGSHGGHSHG